MRLFIWTRKPCTSSLGGWLEVRLEGKEPGAGKETRLASGQEETETGWD